MGMPTDNHLTETYVANHKRRGFSAQCKALHVAPDEQWESETEPDAHAADDNETMTLPEYVRTLGMQEDDTLVREFAQFMSDKCTRIEDRGGEIHYPLKLARWQWLAEYEAFDEQLERQEQEAIRHRHW